ncbi:MAG: hypothetical protein CFH06_01346 [Alphaproteobacteria bacterium MarineAlpha3_Bin5]|nr:MAG: hypothetical protein CFH06_01346 [Alphaproteobacteria bacterium MarineAlpha3_Bin5]
MRRLGKPYPSLHRFFTHHPSVKPINNLEINHLIRYSGIRILRFILKSMILFWPGIRRVAACMVLTITLSSCYSVYWDVAPTMTASLPKGYLDWIRSENIRPRFQFKRDNIFNDSHNEEPELILTIAGEDAEAPKLNLIITN